MELAVARTLLLGLIATVVAVGVGLLTSALGLGLENGVLGVMAGLLLGLVRSGSPLARYGAFLIGLVLGLVAIGGGLAGWIGFVVTILLLTIVSGLTGGRLPLWAMILGAGVFAAMYEPTLMANLWFVLTQYPTALIVALATSAGAFMVTVFVELIHDKREEVAEAEHLHDPEYAASGADNPMGAAK